MCIIFIAQFIASAVNLKQSFNQEEFDSLFDWINELIDTLMKNLNDKNAIIRKNCYKGIGNISLLLKNEFSIPIDDQEYYFRSK